MCGRGTGNVDNQLAPHLMSGQEGNPQVSIRGGCSGPSREQQEGGQRHTCMSSVMEHPESPEGSGGRGLSLNLTLASHHLRKS